MSDPLAGAPVPADATTAEPPGLGGRDAVWPALPLAVWQDTYQTLHM